MLCTTPAAPTYYTHCQVSFSWNNWRRETGGWGRDWRILGVSRGRPSPSVSGIGSGSGRVLNLDRPSGKVSPDSTSTSCDRHGARQTALGFTSVWHPSYKGHVALLNSRRFCLPVDGGDLKGKEKKKSLRLGFPPANLALSFFFRFRCMRRTTTSQAGGLVPATLTRYGNFGARLPFRSGPRPTLAPARQRATRVLSSCRCPRREKVAGNSGQLTVVHGWPNANGEMSWSS